MSASELAKAIIAYPVILKPLVSVCNIAGRAIERDLGIKNLDTYDPKLDSDKANLLAGYIKPFLPEYLAVSTLSQIDRIYFVDKEIRKTKGRWEKEIIKTLNKFSMDKFFKRKFQVDKEDFELDGAIPQKGKVKVGIDIKRIEARRDIHKRCDEIVNKASKLKKAFCDSKFGAVVYYPFMEEHINIQNRLRSDVIDVIVFASSAKENIENAIKMLLDTMGVERYDK